MCVEILYNSLAAFIRSLNVIYIQGDLPVNLRQNKANKGNALQAWETPAATLLPRGWIFWSFSEHAWRLVMEVFASNTDPFTWKIDMQRKQSQTGTDLIVWSLTHTHDVTGATGCEGFPVSSPHPQIHSHGGYHGGKWLSDWWSGAVPLLSVASSHNWVRQPTIVGRTWVVTPPRQPGLESRLFHNLAVWVWRI